MKARELAVELEVTERTIYRDIDALSLAGVPVFSESGPEGGFELLDSYRTNLTGLTEGEVRALFMLSVPAALAELGFSSELRTALLKMSASIPPAHRTEEQRVRGRIYIDSSEWPDRQDSVPHLPILHELVWKNQQAIIRYRPPFAVELSRLIEPLGLVSKAGAWYLVFSRSGSIDAHRVADITDVQPKDQTFMRPASFDLVEFWQEWCSAQEALQRVFNTTIRAAPNIQERLPKYFGALNDGAPGEDGWTVYELTFESFEAARERILGLGRAVEVLEPPALRCSVEDMASQIVDLYRNRSL
jgi:predicted DNA-binding transcriptional regulator YafY